MAATLTTTYREYLGRLEAERGDSERWLDTVRPAFRTERERQAWRAGFDTGAAVAGRLLTLAGRAPFRREG